MGISCAVVLANLFMGSIFKPIIDSFKCKMKTLHYRRGYVDDIILILDADDAVIDDLLKALSKACPGIAITSERSLESAHFLDVNMTKGPVWESDNTQLDTSVFV